jgi:hypothetical protein
MWIRLTPPPSHKLGSILYNITTRVDYTNDTHTWCRCLSNWPSPWPRPSVIGRAAVSNLLSWPGWSVRLSFGCLAAAVAGTPVACPLPRTQAWRLANAKVWTRTAAVELVVAIAPRMPAAGPWGPSRGRHRQLPKTGLPKRTWKTQTCSEFKRHGARFFYRLKIYSLHTEKNYWLK